MVCLIALQFCVRSTVGQTYIHRYLKGLRMLAAKKIKKPNKVCFRGILCVVHVIYDNSYHGLHVQYVEYREKHSSLHWNT